tara:strand:+ start:216 stop:455 length:240 start_codon:yes stop_codon:yes gene_type:complete
LTEIVERYDDEEFLKADGFDDAVIGVCHTSRRLIYSYAKCIEILLNEGMDEIDAIEHLSFNVINGYVGEKTPIWCIDYE